MKADKTYKICDLLPINNSAAITKKKLLIQTLNTLLLIYTSAQEAINQYLDNNYHDFDAQVSENLCQIRACMLASLNQNPISQEETLKTKTQISQIISRIQQLKSNNIEETIRKIQRNDINVPKLISLYGLDTSATEPIIFLICTYILCQFKRESLFHISTGIDYRKLIEASKIESKSFLKKLVHRMQRLISSISSEFILSIAQQTHSSLDLNLLSQLQMHDEIGRSILPCYETTKIILNYMANNDINIRMVVYHKRDINIVARIDTFTMKPKKIGDTFEYYYTPNNSHFMITCFGICDHSNKPLASKEGYINNIMNIGFINIILENMAQHAQYAGKELIEYKKNPYQKIIIEGQSNATHKAKKSEKDFLEHKRLAEIHGCSIQNPSLFLLSHIAYDQRTVSETSKTMEILLAQEAQVA